MTTHRLAPLLGALSLSLTACGPSTTTSDEVAAEALGSSRVATVNGETVPESILRVYALASERKNIDELDLTQRERLVEDLIGVELLNQQAEKDGLAASRTLAAQVELQRLQLVARAMATDYLQKNPPSEAELQQIYDENLPRLAGQQFKARHILVETREEAEAVIAELQAGAEFAALAAARADGPTGPNGGALDWFTLDSIPEPFADAVQALTLGSYTTTPVQTDFGFHVILLEDQRQQEAPALADVRSDLVAAAERKKLEDYIKSLREAADVVVER
jgi:peptidyl-prolyl cis-trans isomerase C